MTRNDSAAPGTKQEIEADPATVSAESAIDVAKCPKRHERSGGASGGVLVNLADAAGLGGRGAVVCIPPHLTRRADLPLPAPWPEIRAVAAIADHPAARDRARERGLTPADFTSEFAREFVREVLSGSVMSPAVEEAYYRHDDDTFSWYGAMQTARRLDEWGVLTEAGAFAAVDTYAAAIVHQSLEDTLHWAADRVRVGEFSCKDRDELDRLLDTAGIVRREVVA